MFEISILHKSEMQPQFLHYMTVLKDWAILIKHIKQE